MAPTVTPQGKVRLAVPTPLCMGVAPGTSLPTVAPVPAPNAPCRTALDAALHASIPMAVSGRTCASPTVRSKITAPGTMGTWHTPMSMPA